MFYCDYALQTPKLYYVIYEQPLIEKYKSDAEKNVKNILILSGEGPALCSASIYQGLQVDYLQGDAKGKMFNENMTFLTILKC